MDARMAALEAVRKAAQDCMNALFGGGGRTVPYGSLLNALAAVDAMPSAQPAGGAVEVAGAVMQNGDEYYVVNESEHGRYHGGIVARFTVSVPVHPIPTLPATMEPAP